MNIAPHSLLVDVRETLLRALSGTEPTNLDAAFSRWVCSSLPSHFTAELPQNLSVVNYRHIAQLGFLCSRDASLLNQYQSLLEEGLQRLAGRPAVMTGGTLAGFAVDTVALLGLALAARFATPTTHTAIVTWMGQFVPNACQGLAAWKRCLAASALNLLGHSSVLLPLPLTSSEADLRVALFQAGAIKELLDPDPDQALPALYEGTLKETDLESPIAAMRLGALDWLISSAPKLSLRQPTRTEVVTLLGQLPAALRRWTWENAPRTKNSTIQRWDIQNEYHVQNLLYFLLAPIFPDLEDEFYSNPVGQKNPRADLGIPSLQLIIEVKFIRPKVAFQDIIEEVAADTSLYFQNNGEYTARYQYLVPFLWDDSRRSQEHAVLRRGLNQLPHVIDSVIISRPGSM